MKRKDIYRGLESIAERSESLTTDIEREGAEMRSELAARTAKGLTGARGVAHYNEWMRKAGLFHLMTSEGRRLCVECRHADRAPSGYVKGCTCVPRADTDFQRFKKPVQATLNESCSDFAPIGDIDRLNFDDKGKRV